MFVKQNIRHLHKQPFWKASLLVIVLTSCCLCSSFLDAFPTWYKYSSLLTNSQHPHVIFHLDQKHQFEQKISYPSGYYSFLLAFSRRIFLQHISVYRPGCRLVLRIGIFLSGLKSFFRHYLASTIYSSLCRCVCCLKDALHMSLVDWTTKNLVAMILPPGCWASGCLKKVCPNKQRHIPFRQAIV